MFFIYQLVQVRTFGQEITCLLESCFHPCFLVFLFPEIFFCREVFADFDPVAVSKYNEKMIISPGSMASSLLPELKLRAVIENARQISKVDFHNLMALLDFHLQKMHVPGEAQLSCSSVPCAICVLYRINFYIKPDILYVMSRVIHAPNHFLFSKCQLSQLAFGKVYHLSVLMISSSSGHFVTNHFTDV